MHRRNHLINTILVTFGIATGPALAQPLAIQNDRGVAYVSGGVGQDERDALNAMAGQFNLGLLFAVQGGAYLSSVHVTVLDARNLSVLDAVSGGPFFYAALPPGRYTITANLDGQSSSRKLTVTAGRMTRADFLWR